MPAVRAHMVLAALTEHGEVVSSNPAPDGLELFDGRQIDAWIATDHDQDSVNQAAGGSLGGLDGRGRESSIPTRSPTPPPSRRPAEPAQQPRTATPERCQGHPHRPRRRGTPRLADAPDGRARDPSHGGGCTDRRTRRPRPPAGHPGAHAQLPGASGDGHAGPHDPRRHRVPALPAAGEGSREQDAARRSSSSWWARTPSSTAPWSTRSATRSCTWSATRSTTGSSRPRSARRRASRSMEQFRSSPAKREAA